MKRTKKLKIAFGIFFGLTFTGLVGGVLYLESERFAQTVKRMISDRSPQKLGVVGDFTNLKLYFFPPGIGIANPKLKVQKENVTKVALQADIEAKELRVSFAPIQMLSGTLQVSEVAVMGGAVQAKLGPDVFKPGKKPTEGDQKLSWQDLFRLQVNGLRFEDTYLNVEAELPRADHAKVSTEFVVKHLEVKKDQFQGRNGFSSNGLVNAVHFEIPKSVGSLPISEANQLQWNIEFTDQGLKLSPFIADFSGTNIHLNGQIAGNLLDEKSDPILTTDAILVSDLSNFFLSNFDDPNWAGQANISAKVQARLHDVAHTLKGSFEVGGTDLVWKEVKVSQLEGAGTLDLPNQKIGLKKLIVQDHTSGVPGSAEIESGSFSLSMNEAFAASIKLDHADLHWLGSPILKDIYGLDGKLTGQIDAQFNPGIKNKWQLKAQTQLQVDQFGLSNQKLGVVKPKHYVLKPVVPIHLIGSVDVNPKGVDFTNYKVKLNRTAFDLSGGVHSGEGYNLKASGPVDMKEFDQIAENDIRGEGELKVHVHGPTSGVLLDFDPQLKNAEYLHMLFGDVNGRVTYDDGIYELRFSNVHAKQQNTFYSVADGFIDLSGTDDVHLPFEINSGRIEDLALVLDPLIKKISWFPKTLQGEVHGKVDLAGKLDTPRMIISSDLEGSDWTWMGERARKVKMNVGYDQGTYFARNVVITKTNGDVKGDIDFVSSKDEMQWDFLTENFSLNDIDFIDRLEIPAKSRIELQSKGSGKMDHLKSKTEGRLYGTELKGEGLDSSLFSLDISENNLLMSLNVFGNRLQSQLKYAMLPKQPSSFSMSFNQFDFSPALLVLNPKLIDDPELKGSINGKIHLDFLSTQSEYARGEINISEYSLKKTGFSLNLVDPIDLPIQLGYFNLKPAYLRFKNSELKLIGEGHKGDIDIRLTGTSDLSAVEMFSSAVQKMSGKADTEIHLSGPLKELKVNGDITFSNAYGLMRFMQTPFEEMDGTIRIRQGLVYVENIESYLGDEVFSMNGKIETFTDHFPKLDLRMQLDDNKIKMPPLDLVQVRGISTIKGDQPPYVIGGNLDVAQAIWTKSFSQSSGAVARGERFAPQDREKQLVSNLFNLDLNVTANQSFFVRNDIVDGEFRGKVRLVGPPENPKILGDGQLIQGKVLFRDRPFVFESAKIEFDDPYQINPKFNAAAVAEVNQYKIKVLAYGRANAWKAEFSSTPFLAESEIYSLLASGLTTAETGRFRTKDRSYVNQGEAASLILHSLDFSKDVQSKTGFQFDVEEAVDTQSASSVFRPQSLSDNIAAPKLVIKRKLGRQFDLSFGSTVGVGNQSQKEVNAEYKLTPGMSVLGVWNNIEEVNVRETRTSFGLDVKFNKKFK
jgi:hypothetical protein